MTSRRYSDDEVRRILSVAAEAERAAVPAEGEWTLTDIEQIGREAGLSPQAVTAAAVALEQSGGTVAPARLLGLPLTVSRAVPLARELTDEGWEQLVAQLRETFAVEGRTRVAGAQREWRVGNLRVTHEPSGEGALLRLRTRKGNVRSVLLLGVAMIAIGASLAMISAMVGADGGEAVQRAHRTLAVGTVLGLWGLVLAALGVLRLPGWARERARQFEALAGYARRLT